MQADEKPLRGQSAGTPERDTNRTIGVYSDRVYAAEETLLRIQPFLPTYGITRLARLTGLDEVGIPVWNAISPNSRSIVINQGKGLSDLDAKVSAAMEALERAIACAPEVQSTISTGRGLLAAGDAIETLDCLIASARPILGLDEEISWIDGQNLMTEQKTWVPYDASTLDRTNHANRFWQSSDGLASGNTHSEAVAHGLLERIERDAVLLSQLTTGSPKETSCVDPASFDDPVINDLCGKFGNSGLTLRLFDVTSDIGIPCFTALVGPSNIHEARQLRHIDIAEGAGAHIHPVRAVIRAMTEAAQSRLTYISGARDDLYPEIFTRPLSQEIRERFACSQMPYRGSLDLPPGDVEWLLEEALNRLKRAGIETVVAVPLCDGKKPFAVVKVFVPELENPTGDRRVRLGVRAISRSLTML